MYKRVDIGEDDCYEGWSFVDEDNDEFYVDTPESSIVRIGVVHDNSIGCYKKNIPKLIKALQAAYDYEE